MRLGETVQTGVEHLKGGDVLPVPQVLRPDDLIGAGEEIV